MNKSAAMNDDKKVIIWDKWKKGHSMGGDRTSYQ